VPPPPAPPKPPAALVTYLPKAGAQDPALFATARRLLAARGIGGPRSPILRLVLIEPQWQSEREHRRGNIARRTRNAAVVYQEPAAGGRPVVRFVLLAADAATGGRGGARYGPVYLRDLGAPRPVAPSAL
jgi:hypothetical protein